MYNWDEALQLYQRSLNLEQVTSRRQRRENLVSPVSEIHEEEEGRTDD
jgi:hypothetical protein